KSQGHTYFFPASCYQNRYCVTQWLSRLSFPALFASSPPMQAGRQVPDHKPRQIQAHARKGASRLSHGQLSTQDTGGFPASFPCLLQCCLRSAHAHTSQHNHCRRLALSNPCASSAAPISSTV